MRILKMNNLPLDADVQAIFVKPKEQLTTKSYHPNVKNVATKKSDSNPPLLYFTEPTLLIVKGFEKETRSCSTILYARPLFNSEKGIEEVYFQKFVNPIRNILLFKALWKADMVPDKIVDLRYVPTLRDEIVVQGEHNRFYVVHWVEVLKRIRASFHNVITIWVKQVGVYRDQPLLELVKRTITEENFWEWDEPYIHNRWPIYRIKVTVGNLEEYPHGLWRVDEILEGTTMQMYQSLPILNGSNILVPSYTLTVGEILPKKIVEDYIYKGFWWYEDFPFPTMQ